MPDAGHHDISLVFLVDALGYELVGRGGFLDSLAGPERPRVSSVLGFSSAAIPSILTGRTPAEHGHWSMYRARIGPSVFDRYRALLSMADRLPRGHWRVRRWLTDRLRSDGVTGYFALYEVPLRHLRHFDLCEKRNIYHPRAFDGIDSLFDRLAAAAVPYRVWDWSVPSEQAFTEMETLAGSGAERFLFLYTAGLDEVLHLHGPSSPAVKEWLRSCEEAILRIVSAARTAGRRPRIRIFGDHGMAQVHACADISEDLAKLPHRMPRDYIVFLDSTMARFWFHKDQARQDIMEHLLERRDGRFLSAEELSHLGVAFSEHDYGEEIFLVDPGILILPSFMGSTPIQGMHGYHPEDRDSDTTLIAEPKPEKTP